MTMRDTIVDRVAEKEMQRILTWDQASFVQEGSYTPQEIALAKSCQQRKITREAFLKQRMAHLNKTHFSR